MHEPWFNPLGSNQNIIDILVMVIPEAIFQAEAVKFGSVGGVNNISSGFCDNQFFFFFLNILCIF